MGLFGIPEHSCFENHSSCCPLQKIGVRLTGETTRWRGKIVQLLCTVKGGQIEQASKVGWCTLLTYISHLCLHSITKDTAAASKTIKPCPYTDKSQCKKSQSPFLKVGLKICQQRMPTLSVIRRWKPQKNQSTPRMMSNDISHQSLLAALLL